jgi:flavin reductase (DIM6/NTAB) family NADH-FMN oxidoreductase RutF
VAAELECSLLELQQVLNYVAVLVAVLRGHLDEQRLVA